MMGQMRGGGGGGGGGGEMRGRGRRGAGKMFSKAAEAKMGALLSVASALLDRDPELSVEPI